MCEIELIDFKGDRITLIFIGGYKVSWKGLTETFVWVEKDWLPTYSKMPVPVFTDWWIVPNHLTRA